MKIYVDADACPVVGIVEKIAEKYNVPVILLCDTNHVLASEYSELQFASLLCSLITYRDAIFDISLPIFRGKR